MAINTTTRQTTAFTSGNNFAFAFKVYEVGDVKVIQIQTSNGAETVLTITTNYTVTLNDDQNANPGGTVTLVSSGSAQNLASGYNIVITSKVSPLQQTEITNQGGFFPEVINDVFDKAVILDQQQQSVIDKTIRFPITQTVGGLEITENATDRANKSFRFDSSGDLELYNQSSVNEFTTAEKNKLAGIEASATADQTASEIRTLVESATDSNVFTDAEKTKLSGVEASADVTDATNVNAAGAVMNSDTTTASMNFVVDEDNLASNSDTKVPTQQSVKKYIDDYNTAAINNHTQEFRNKTIDADLNTISNLVVSNFKSGVLDTDLASVSSSDDTLASAKAIKTYVDANAGGTDLSSGGTINGDLTLTGANYNAVWDKSDNALEFADQAKATFGDGGDLQIYHQTSGNHSIIKETGSGSLIIQAENLDVQDTSGNSVLLGIHDSYVSLAHHGDTRLITSSTGITVYSGASGSETATGAITSGNIGVTGNITVSGTVDGRDVATDGTKLDGIEASADVTDATNVNAAGAVMNSDLDGKGELLVGDGSGDPSALAAGTNGYVLKANSSTATGLEWSAAGSGGDVNQNAFSTIAVSGQSNVAADSATDTLNIAAGSNVTVTTNASSDTVTISSTDTNTTYSVGDGGLSQNNFTDALKTKLDGIAASANVGLTDIVGDTTPQLGGNLDVQSSEITTSTSNGNIKLNPNGTGVVEVKGDGSSADGTIQLNCSQNSHGIKLKSPPHSAGASYTLTFPNTDGSANQVLKTDGSGGLDWVDQTTDTNTQLSNAEVRTAVEAASDSNVFTDADHSKLNAIEASATADQTASEIKTLLQSDKLTVNEIADDAVTADKLANSINTEITANTAKTSNATHTGEVTGSTALTIADNVVDEANLKVSNTPTNGYVLTAQSGNTGGLTWAAASGGGGGLSSDSDKNTVGGTNAGDSITAGSGVNNTLIGYDAGTSLTTGDHSTALGKDALKSVTTAYGNMGIGKSAGDSLTTGQQNTCIGLSAGHNLTTQSQNVCVGEDAMAQTKGANNTSVGFQSMGQAYFGDYNVALGSEALKVVGGSSDGSGGDYNVAIGYQAGDALETGSNNIIIGKNAAATSDSTSNEITLGNTDITKFRVPGLNFVIKDSTATDNYVLTVDANGEAGWEAAAGGGGGLSSDAQNNTVGGSNAGDSFSGTDAVSNTLIGKNAGTAITTADECVAIGHDAGSSNTTASGMTSIGFEAGKNYTVTGGTFIGYQAGKGLSDGQQNTAIGEAAMSAPTSSGTYANTYIGYAAGQNHGNGNQNTGIGLNVLRSNAAWSNIAIGNNAGGNNTSGTRGTFIGRYAGDQNTTGSYNFCAGYYAGGDVTTGSSNTFIGDQAGHTGTNNVTTGSNNTLIGAQAVASSATVSNEITIGDANVTKFRIPGLNSFEINDSGQFSGVASTASGTAGVRKITASTSAPSGGADGDIWIKHAS